MDHFALFALKLFLGIFNLLPVSLRLSLIYGFIRVYTAIFKSFDRVSLINLKQVYPNLSEGEGERLLEKSKRSLARFVLDSMRFHLLDESWVKAHIECPFKEGYLELKKRHGGKGVLTASGHLGSIELQALAAPFVGRKFSFIARSLKNIPIDGWWRSRREKFGNEVIPRKGAVAKVISNLNAGIDVAILIDQNVQRKNALFVDWFGRSAATTFAFGHAAVETRAPVVLSAITYLGDDKYRVEEHECDLSSILDDPSLDKAGKVLAITRKISAEYQKLILKHPEEWFWMHRRWKTTPEGIPEDFYR